jgi:hypothetical protein
MGAVTINLPRELDGYEEDLRRFFDAMVFKLRKNAHKGRWEGYSLEQVVELLDVEALELRRAVNMDNCVEITLEAADVANFALIISAIGIERGRKPTHNVVALPPAIEEEFIVPTGIKPPTFRRNNE